MELFGRGAYVSGLSMRNERSAGELSLPRFWFLLLLAMLPLPAVWALANPMFASPDEPAHIVRAQGAIAGNLRGPYTTDGVPIRAVECLKFRSDTTADCMDLTWGASGLEQRSRAETYPPLFHAVAGMPSWFLSGLIGAYAMRLWLVLVACAMLAWAAVLLWTRRPDAWSVAALFVATTPMVVFTIATVNPSGLTAAFAALIWAAGINVTSPRTGTPPRASAWTFLAALLLYPLLRRDAPIWEAVLLLILATTLTWSRLRALARDRLVVGAAVLGAIAMACVWIVWSAGAIASFIAKGAKEGGGSSARGAGALTGYLHEIAGIFGWLDAPVSREVLLLMMGTLAAVLVAGAASGTRVEMRASLVALAVLVVTPVAIGTIQFPYFQVRYVFPVYIGAVLMAGQALAGAELPARRSRILLRATVAALALVQFAAFAQNLRRYAVGSSGTWLALLTAPRWQPPAMSNRAALLLALAAIGVAILVTGAALRRAPRIAAQSGPAGSGSREHRDKQSPSCRDRAVMMSR